MQAHTTTSDFTVTITDDEAPAIADTPANITQNGGCRSMQCCDQLHGTDRKRQLRSDLFLG